MNFWKSLLIEQKDRGKKGFTLPFIIGSQKYLPRNIAKLDISQLILDIVVNDLFETCIRYCMDTNDLILEIRNKNIPVVYPKINISNQNNFSVSIANNDLGENIDSITLSLIDRYQKFIDAGQFSINEGERGGFSIDDEIFIKKAFQAIYKNEN